MKILFPVLLAIGTITTQLDATETSRTTDLDLFQQAVELFETGDAETAKKHFEAILSRDAKHTESLIYLATIDFNDDALDEALDLIEQAIEHSPDHALAHNLSGRINANIAKDASIFTARGYAKDSLAGFSRAVELAPDNLDFRMSLMRFHLNAPSIAGGDKELAMAEAKAIEQSPLCQDSCRL